MTISYKGNEELLPYLIPVSVQVKSRNLNKELIGILRTSGNSRADSNCLFRLFRIDLCFCKAKFCFSSLGHTLTLQTFAGLKWEYGGRLTFLGLFFFFFF